MGAFFNSQKKSSFEKAQAILLAYFKSFSTAEFCFRLSRISATPTERLIPPKAPLFGTLGRTITN